MWIPGLRRKPKSDLPETVESLIASVGEIRELLDGLGYDRHHEMAADRLMAELKSSIRAEVTDYPAFQAALATAGNRRRSMPPGVSFALLDALNAARDQDAALALLNADPIHDQVPFIEQIPVPRNGELTWQSPVDHSLIRRRPVDLPRFRDIIDELESLFSEPHPARAESSRIEVLDAIARLRRELDRDRSYLPTPLQFLEAKLRDYKTKSLKPAAAEWAETLLSTLKSLIEISQIIRTKEKNEVARQIARQAARYVATPRIQTPWLTGHILGLSLHSRLTGTGSGLFGNRHRKTMERVRMEIQGGYYDSRETIRRLRRMEALGFRIPTLVYPLLRIPVSRKIT